MVIALVAVALVAALAAATSLLFAARAARAEGRAARADSARERAERERITASSEAKQLRGELDAAKHASLAGATVVVTTHPDNVTYRGVVAAEHADRITLRDAFVVTAGAEHQIGGLQHVYRASFTGLQQIKE